ALAATDPTVAVTRTEPAARAMMVPVVLTLTTSELSLFQVMVAPSSTRPCASSALASRLYVSPIARRVGAVPTISTLATSERSGSTVPEHPTHGAAAIAPAIT